MATVTVIEKAASFRRGLETALTDAGHSIAPEGDGADVALVTLRDEDDCVATEHLVAKGAIVVALLPDADAASHAHALGHGATAAAPWDADPAEIVGTVEAAVAGWTRFPKPVAADLAGQWPGAHQPKPDLTADELQWLTDLASGRTVISIADESGYSERAMFRRLHELYERLGVNGRTEAIVAAQRLGLLDQEG